MLLSAYVIPNKDTPPGIINVLKPSVLESTNVKPLSLSYPVCHEYMKLIF